MTAVQLDLFAEAAVNVNVPGHRYQRIGICQCQLRANDSISGMFGSIDRFGVHSRFAMTPADHAEHIGDILHACNDGAA